MREIKFRAFWTKDKRMDYDPYGDEFLCEGTPINKVFNVWPFREGEAVLMQFTGAFDKDGKEIFEGDLIEFDREEWGGDNNVHVISWNDEDFGWCFGGGSAKNDMGFRKVIGNIYENPELLPK